MDEKLSIKELARALGEWDYAMRAASYGSNGARHVLVNAIQNLPTPELDALRPEIERAIKAAVSRTQNAVEALGIVMDAKHPLRVKAAIDDPGSYFFNADRK